MKRLTYALECITPCFCGGADHTRQAEIRVPSIRGQLRWWLRTLGGSRLLDGDVRAQENVLFGSASGDEGRSGLLTIRVSALDKTSLVSQTVKDDIGMKAEPNTARGYALFPLRKNKDGKSNARGVFDEGSLPCFLLHVIYKREAAELTQTLHALISIFGHLGALGFRSRRAMGALAFLTSDTANMRPMPLKEALAIFRISPVVRCLDKCMGSADDAIDNLIGWFKTCRAHGRSGKNEQEKKSPYFHFAENDHDIGYGIRKVEQSPAYRPALGLPIIQRTKHQTNNWEWEWNAQTKKGEGRFASPVILRPHRDEQGKWHALVIFVDAHKWPTAKKAYVNGVSRDVSLDLYEEMKRDQELESFAGQGS